ncbi:RHS repeat-associated core domain-containing protein [Patulibacter sp. SYSU D01012]|uniref:RHS repeat-associated core domain-containing protein n=1 Tax=Patulibacter sp. SYSU D01012 TaxID=2817381 RepID=UPI001B305E4A|nr:RHS repeat-associated core domain-containing protein [Patulibacter sp. SYSU D01012]
MAASLVVLLVGALMLATGAWLAGAPSSTASAAGQAHPAGHPGGPVNFSREDPRVTEHGLRKAETIAARRRARLATPESQAERARSRRAYRGAGPAEALRIARREQPEIAVQPLWRGPAVAKDERIVEYTSPISAIVATESSKDRSRVEAIGAPFAVGPKPGTPAPAKELEPIDLTLEADGHGWSPERPAVATTLPRDTAEPVVIGPDLSIDLRQDRDRAPSVGTPTGKTKIFYGGVTTDTDAIVEPVADGVSLSWLLRSPTAPARLAFDLRGATPDGGKVNPDGSLTLWDGGREIGSVSAPRAVDAQGTAVAARFVVEDDAVSVALEHRGRDLAYPIAVDPVIHWPGTLHYILEQDDSGVPAPGPARNGWVPHSFAPAAFRFDEYGFGRSITTTGQGPGSGWFSFNPIRTSAPYKVQYTDVQLTQPNPANLDACQNVGIFTEVSPGVAGPATAKHAYWAGNYTQGGATPWNGETLPTPTGEGTGMYSNCAAATPASFVEVCAAANCQPVGASDNATAAQLNTAGAAGSVASFTGAYVFHREDVAPTVTATPGWNPAAWTSLSGGEKLTVSAHDDGVGLCGDQFNGFPAATELADAAVSGLTLAVGRNQGCTGMTYDRPAPADYVYELQPSAASAREGVRSLTLTTRDALGNQTTSNVGLRFDRLGPNVELSGALYEQRDTPLAVGGSRPLTIAATDGTVGAAPADARAGVQRIQVYANDALVKTEEQTLSGDGQPLSAQWAPAAGSLEDIVYRMRVVATDRAGNETTERFVVKVGTAQIPRDPERGLGFENWQTYDSTDTGAGSVHRVNLATGNSLWSVTPVSNPGIGFDTALRLTYNSLEPSALVPDLASYKPFAYGVAGRGVSVQLGSITRLNEPLWMENGNGAPSFAGSSDAVQRVMLTDGDGTRHVFTRTTEGGVRFAAPPGVHLELRRFENVEASAHYWAATRPDGSTYFFYRDGRPSEAMDRHGNTMRLTWEQRPDYASSPTTPGCGYASACRYRVTEVLDAGALDATGLVGSGNTAANRKWILHYDAANPMRLTSVEDRKRLSGPNGPVRRQTTLSYDSTGRLTAVTAAANAPSGAARRVWGLGYLDGSSFLTRITDPMGNDTRVRYGDPQGAILPPFLAPLTDVPDPLLGFAATVPEARQVRGVADRASTRSGTTESRERIFRFDPPTAAPDGMALTTWVRNARKSSARYSMDHRGRLTRLVEDLDDPLRNDDRLPTGAGQSYAQRATTQTWNDAVNAVASVTRGLKGVDGTLDASQATATEYQWGALGQLQREWEHKGVAGASPGGDDQRARSWTYNTHNGTVEGEGDGGRAFVYDTATESDRRGKITTYHYDDEKGDPRQVDEPGGAEEDFRYNSRGLVTEHSVRQWGGSGNGDDSGKPSWARADPSIGGDTSEGTFATDTFGEFDGNGDAGVRIDPRGKNWRTYYDDTGNAVLVADARAGGLLAMPGSEAVLANTDDPVSALTGTLRDAARSGSGGGQPYVARYTFDSLDRQVAAATPKRSAAVKPGTQTAVDDRYVVTATTYDRNDNVTAERDAESQVTSRTFTKTDQLEAEQEPAAPQHAEPGPGDPEAWGNGAERAPVTKFAYDENDNLTVRKDPVPNGDEPIGAVGYRTRWTFDRLDRSVLQVEEGTSAAAPELKLTSRAYDLRDNVVAEIDPRTNGVTAEATTIANAAAGQGLRYRFEYDPFDRLVRQTENPREESTATDVNRVTRWGYDAEDNQTSTATPRQRETLRSYDDRGDLVRIDEPFDFESGPGNEGATDSVATTTITRRLDGRPSQIISPRGNDDEDPVNDGSSFRTRFKYFDTGELQRRWLPRVKGQYGPSSWQVRYDINAVGDPVAIRDARGRLFENTFVDTGELATTTRPSWWIYDQDSASIRERTPEDPAPADPSSGAGGLPSAPGNGDFGKVQPQALPDVMPAAGDTAVSYNDRLQPTTVKGQGDEADDDTISQTLDYDRLGRLTRRELPMRNSTAAGSTVELAWQYDVRGLPRAARRLRQSADGGSATTFWNYDGFGREIKMTAPPSCQGTGCLPPITTKAYDRNDALTDEVLPSHDEAVQGRVGTTTGTRHYTIDRADRRVATDDETGAHTETVYDLDDLVAKRYGARAFVSDEGGAGSATAKEQYSTRYRYDGGGRVVREASTVTDADGTRELVTTTKYDREGNPIRTDAPGARSSETDSGTIAQRTTSRVYDARGLLWKRTIGAGDNATTTITEYDGAGNLRRTVNPKGVDGTGATATPKYDDGSDSGIEGRSAWHATVQSYDADQGLIGRTMPWSDADGDPSDGDRHRYRQTFERGKRGLVTRITEVFDAKDGSGSAKADTQIDRNLVGWPTRSTDRRLAGSSWTTVGAPLKYDYDQLGNQTEWSSVGGNRTIQRSFYRSGQLRVKCGRRTAGGSQEQVYSYRYSRSGALNAIVDWMHHTAPSADPERCQPEEDDDKGILEPRKTVIKRDRADRPTIVNETWDGGKDTAIRYFGSVPNLIKSVQTDGKVTGTDGNGYSGGKSTAYSYDQQDRNTQVRVRDDGDLSGTPNRTTDMAWWPSGERRSTKKPKTSDDKRTVDSRFYNSRGEVVRRRADPATGATKTYVYEYDKNGNRTKDERGTSDYNARDQITEWHRIRRTANGDAIPEATDAQGYVAPTEKSPAKTTKYTRIDGAGRPEKIEETIKAPQSGIGLVETTIKTENAYNGDQLAKALRTTKAVPPSGANAVQSTSAQTDCFDYDVFGSQTQTYRQTTTKNGTSAGQDVTPDTPTSSCKSEAGAWKGVVESRNVFDTFERQTASRQRSHGKVDESDDGALNGTQAFCYDPLDRRDRRVVGLTGAADPAAAEEEGDGRTRAQTACTKPASEIGPGVVAYDYGYVGLTEQLSREIRAGREQSYDYTASGERLGRLKGAGSSREWRAYDTDAQGSVVGLEKPTGETTPDADGKLNTYETDPFGDPVGKESDLSDEAAENPFRFQGFYSDPGTGTYDMQARAYQPSTGRFLQQDRFEDPEADLRLLSDPMTSSRYAFTAGNPATYSEYDGHVPAYTSGDEPRDKHNRDAAAKGADSPARRAERRQYRGSIAAQDAYHAVTGRPLKGEGSHVGSLPPLRVVQPAKGGGSSLLDDPQGALQDFEVEAAKGGVDAARDTVDYARQLYRDPGGTLRATGAGIAALVGPDGADTWMAMLHDQCDGTSLGRCFGRLGAGIAGAKGVGAGVRAGASGARLGRWGRRSAGASPPRFDIAPRVAGQLQDKRMKHLQGKLGPADLQKLINEPSALRMLDTRSGHINVVQDVEGVPLRITTPRDEFTIISVGPMRPRQVPNGLKSGRFLPLP